MVRHVQVTLPASKYKRIYNVLKSRSCVYRLEGWPISEERCVIIFKIVEKKMHVAIEILKRYGIGISEAAGTIDIFSLCSTKPRVTPLKSIKKKKKYNMSDSLSYEEIYDIVDSQLHLTFDYLALCSVGAMIAGIGLLSDSSVSVVASMLVSPLMGPIVGMTFSAIIRDKAMFKKSFRNELYGVLLCWAWGIVMGFVISPFVNEGEDMAMTHDTQMTSRGTAQGLLEGLFVAIPSGCGVALGVASDQINPLVGVAISASLLPPIVNSGLAIAMGFMAWMDDDDDYIYRDHWTVGMYSMTLFLMNWIIILIFAYLMFKVKRLNAHKKASKQEQHLQRFNHMTDTQSERRQSQATWRTASDLRYTILNADEVTGGSDYLDFKERQSDCDQQIVAKSYGNISLMQVDSSKLLDLSDDPDETKTNFSSPRVISR